MTLIIFVFNNSKRLFFFKEISHHLQSFSSLIALEKYGRESVGDRRRAELVGESRGFLDLFIFAGSRIFFFGTLN